MPKVKIEITLENAGGGLDRETFEVDDAGGGLPDPDQVDDRVGEILERWILAVDDTIKIREVEA